MSDSHDLEPFDDSTSSEQPDSQGDAIAGVPVDDLSSMLGGLDLGSMMQMASDMQAQMTQAQAELAATTVEGTAGAGMVRVTLSGYLHLVGLHIDPAAADPEDPSLLEDLVLAAWQDAHAQVARLQSETDPLGGMGGLGGLLGGG